MSFTIRENILHKSQLGFIPGNRTSDAHIIINNLIKRTCHKNNDKIYGCFIDFSKAFDTIPRDILLKKLLNYGITGKVFNVIRSIYTNDSACIKISNQLTKTFELSRGGAPGVCTQPSLI